MQSTQVQADNTCEQYTCVMLIVIVHPLVHAYLPVSVPTDSHQLRCDRTQHHLDGNFLNKWVSHMQEWTTTHTLEHTRLPTYRWEFPNTNDMFLSSFDTLSMVLIYTTLVEICRPHPRWLCTENDGVHSVAEFGTFSILAFFTSMYKNRIWRVFDGCNWTS